MNRQLFQLVNDFSRATPWLHGLAAAFAVYGVVLFGALLLAGVWSSRHAPSRTLAAAVWAGAGVLVAVAANQPLSTFVAERRPYAGHPAVLVLIDRTTDWSFPSDHSVMAGAAAAGLLALTRLHPRLRHIATVAIAAAVLMAATRVYVGVHYPLDVAAGLAVGAAVSALGWLVVRRPLTSMVQRWRVSAVAPRAFARSGASASRMSTR